MQYNLGTIQRYSKSQWNYGMLGSILLKLSIYQKFCLSVFFPETSAVTGTNRIDFSLPLDERTQRYVICSAEDNLIKGAGGQAIQAMNVCQGYEQELGLL